MTISPIDLMYNLSSTTPPAAHLIILTGSILCHHKITYNNLTYQQYNNDSKHKNYENTGLKPYITNSVVFTQIRTHSYTIIGAMSVVTTRISFAVGVDAFKIIMNFIIIMIWGY
jgi:hypothetical protein